MEIQNLKFMVIGGKTPKEMLAAPSEGYFEIFRELVPGGFEVTFAKMMIGLIGKARKNVFLLKEMPPESLIDPLVQVQEVEMNRPNMGTMHGSYGIVQGRKFFVPSATGASKPSAGTAQKEARRKIG